ncbi:MULTISPECIES: hypothetical protein [unclassified Rathayibacter]|uniref:hypothetical protein n=1 Tax=unclassified Rathayibacter TaxID=2609250 RepID=UPI001FB359FF|nr:MULTISPECIES: hypothetical protein [unclassified Rathayibacter]MCJ1674577.1 hypothetical protein [Rathayibacter sp. VKM Ac-2929]MCJ1684858.1 hypothetical protein [Rathayibacter sp. VKM Ac-2928]
MSDSTHRRVLVGLDDDGRSTVVGDAFDLPIVRPSAHVTLQEIWRQDSIPARLDDATDPRREGSLPAPPNGAVVRILTIAPFSGVSTEWAADLHFDDSLHIITMTTGLLDIVLEEGEVSLAPGDSIVLPASMHDLRNTSGAPATFVYTSFPLER